MDYQAIREVLHEHFKEGLERHRNRLAQQGRLPYLDKTALKNAHAFTAQALQKQDYSFVGTDSEMAKLIDSYALPIQPNSKDYATLRTEFLKAFRDYCTTALQDDDALESYDFSQTPASMNKPVMGKQKKLADLIAQYSEEKVRLKQWRVSVAKDYSTQFNLLLRYLGQDASLHITSEVANDVKRVLLSLPKHINQKSALKSLSIAELTSLNVPQSQRLSASSVAKHIRTYSTFYDWAVQKKHTTENNFGVLVDDVKNTHVERGAFSLEDSKRIFSSVKAVTKSHQRWGVPIAFYTGARLNEIAQLETSDIVEVEGILCFRFTDEGEQKTLKNKASRRVIPIHSHLIKLGFLDFVKQSGKGRLFGGLTHHPKDGYGRNLGRWFNGSLLRKQLSITSPTLVFHSIRHTVAQQLRNNKVQEATLKDILGHAQVGVTMGTYASKLDKRVMQEAIETLRY